MGPYLHHQQVDVGTILTAVTPAGRLQPGGRHPSSTAATAATAAPKVQAAQAAAAVAAAASGVDASAACSSVGAAPPGDSAAPGSRLPLPPQRRRQLCVPLLPQLLLAALVHPVAVGFCCGWLVQAVDVDAQRLGVPATGKQWGGKQAGAGVWFRFHGAVRCVWGFV